MQLHSPLSTKVWPGAAFGALQPVADDTAHVRRCPPYLPFVIRLRNRLEGEKFAEGGSSPLPLLQHKPPEYAGQLREVGLLLHVEDEVQ